MGHPHDHSTAAPAKMHQPGCKPCESLTFPFQAKCGDCEGIRESSAKLLEYRVGAMGRPVDGPCGRVRSVEVMPPDKRGHGAPRRGKRKERRTRGRSSSPRQGAQTNSGSSWRFHWKQSCHTHKLCPQPSSRPRVCPCVRSWVQNEQRGPARCQPFRLTMIIEMRGFC
jgi:hypothetical protein